MRNLTFCFIFMDYPDILHCYINITELLSLKRQTLTDISENNCQIKRKSDRNFFLKCANEPFVTKGHSTGNRRVNDIGI